MPGVRDAATWYPGFEASDAFRGSKAYLILTPTEYGDLRYSTLKKHHAVAVHATES